MMAARHILDGEYSPTLALDDMQEIGIVS